ncbi:MAG: hypothetical protein SFH39_05840 [Candidatus Magnetobacterium sp. LHC-1]
MTINFNKFDENRGAIYVDHEVDDNGYANITDVMNGVKNRLIEAHKHTLPELPHLLQYKTDGTNHILTMPSVVNGYQWELKKWVNEPDSDINIQKWYVGSPILILYKNLAITK